MKEVWKKLKNKNAGLGGRVLRSELPILIVLTIVVVVYVLFIGQQERIQETRQKSSLRAQQIASLLDSNLTGLERYYSAMAGTSELETVLKNPSYYYDDTVVKRIAENMLGGGIYDDLVFDFVLYDTQSMHVLGSDGAYPAEEYPGYMELGELLRFKSEGRTYWDDTEEGMLKYIMKLPLDAVTPHVIAVVEINLGRLKQLTTEMMIADENVFVLSKDRLVFKGDYSQIDAGQSEIVWQEREKELRYIHDNKIYIGNKEQSKVVDWSYVVLYKKPGMLEFGTVYFATAAVMLLLTVGVLFMFSVYRISRPVERLIQKVGKQNDKGSYETELEYIEKKLTNLSSDAELLEETVQHQQIRIQQMFELRLINDGIRSEEEWDDYFESLNLPKYERFATAVMVLDLRYNSKVQLGLNEDAICLEMIDQMPERGKELLWMPPVYNSCTIFSLIGANSEDELLSKTNEYFGIMMEFSEKMTGFPIIMGVSGTHKDHRKIRLAYRESAMALMSNPNEGRDYDEVEAEYKEQGIDKSQSLRYYVEKLPQQTVEYYDSYNTKYENEVQLALKEADTQRAYRATDRFAEYLLTVKTTDDALYCILRYAEHVVEIGLEYNIPLGKIFPRGMRVAYRELISELEPRRVRSYIKEFFIDPVIGQMNDRMKQGSHLVMERIDALLAETHGNLLLSECADRLELNQNYIWKILKMERGKTFTEYAEKYKIEEAKKLLSETNLSVQEIALRLDYANAQNFIRFFSKATGITPGKFRKMS